MGRFLPIYWTIETHAPPEFSPSMSTIWGPLVTRWPCNWEYMLRSSGLIQHYIVYLVCKFHHTNQSSLAGGSHSPRLQLRKCRALKGTNMLFSLLSGWWGTPTPPPLTEKNLLSSKIYRGFTIAGLLSMAGWRSWPHGPSSQTATPTCPRKPARTQLHADQLRVKMQFKRTMQSKVLTRLWTWQMNFLLLSNIWIMSTYLWRWAIQT